MKILEEGKKLLERHDSLFNLLYSIPEERSISYREELLI